MDFLAVISGFGVGGIVGLTRVGGGSLMTPLLMGVFRLSPQRGPDGARADAAERHHQGLGRGR